MSKSFEALRRANPRGRPEFASSVEAAAALTRARIAADTPYVARRPARRRAIRLSAAGAVLAVAGAVAAVLLVGESPTTGGAGGVPDAAAAMQRAVRLTADSAERSGTAVVRITRDGGVWAQTTILWHDEDISVGRDSPARPENRYPMLVVGGVLYMHDPRVDRWVAFGDPSSIDPDSGTTPSEYLAAAREDIGGTTLRRITEAMSGLTTTRREDGLTVYAGTVAAGEIARETGFKGGQAIRVLPFGFVANDEAADPASQLEADVTVGADGVVREDRGQLGQVEVHGHLRRPRRHARAGRAGRRDLAAEVPSARVDQFRRAARRRQVVGEPPEATLGSIESRR